MPTFDLRPLATHIRESVGDDIGFSVVCTDDAGDPFDLTGYTFVGGIVSKTGLALGSFSISVAGDTVTATLTSAASTAIGVMKGRWYFRATVGGVSNTWFAGEFELSSRTKTGHPPTFRNFQVVVGAQLRAEVLVGVPGPSGGVDGESGSVGVTAIDTIVSLTQADYDLLAPPDASTLYVIV